MKKKICFVIPDGVGIRNYLYSDVLKSLEAKEVDTYIWHSISDNAILEIIKIHPYLKKSFYKLPQFKEPKLQYFLRELICFSRLNYNVTITKNNAILKNWRPQKKGLKKWFYEVIELFGKFFSRSNKRILRLEKIYTKLLSNSSYHKYTTFLKDKEIDVVFCTHQRATQAIPAIESAKKNGIKTIGAIFSWDNLPKARISVKTENYVVWSNYMKEEMNFYYPEIENKNIKITGTPQFEFYTKKELLWSKETFFKKYDLDFSKKVICFSGDDVRTSPYDPIYLEDLAEEIQKMPKEKQPQILFRKCPVDISGRYKNIIKKYSNTIKEAPPLWCLDSDTKEKWSLIYPKYDDIQLLVNTVFHTDLVINLGSTMAHDYTVYNKPCLYLNYDPVSNPSIKIETIYNYQHFRSMPNKKAVGWLNSKEDIIPKITAAINNQQANEQNRNKWFHKIVEYKESASNNIVNFIVE